MFDFCLHENIQYKLTLWDIRNVFDCRIRRKNGQNELLFTVEIANALNQKVEVSKHDINGSTVTRGDIFVRFFKKYNCENTHQLEKLLLDKLNEKHIDLESETDEPEHFANIPQLRPQTITKKCNNIITLSGDEDDGDDGGEEEEDGNTTLSTNNRTGLSRQSAQIISIQPINIRKRKIDSIFQQCNTKYGNPFLNPSSSMITSNPFSTLTFPSLSYVPPTKRAKLNGDTNTNNNSNNGTNTNNVQFQLLTNSNIQNNNSNNNKLYKNIKLLSFFSDSIYQIQSIRL